jgi:hypothetical protein
VAQAQITAVGIVDANGNLSIKFPQTSVGAEFTGVVSVPSSPSTTIWNVVINDTTVSTNGGSSQYGPLQLNSSDVLMLEGSGLAPGTQYQGVLIGALVQGTAGAVIPTPTASALSAAILALPSSGIAGIGGGLDSYITGTVNSGAAAEIALGVTLAQLWVWGVQGLSAPIGPYNLAYLSLGGEGDSTIDTLEIPYGMVSNRLSGLQVSNSLPLYVLNEFASSAEFFFAYSTLVP